MQFLSQAQVVRLVSLLADPLKLKFRSISVTIIMISQRRTNISFGFLRILGDTGRATFFQFICFTKKLEQNFFTKIYKSYVKSVKESKIFVQNVLMSCGS